MVPVPVSLICQSSGLQLHFSDLRPVGPFMAQWPLAYIPNCTRLDINSIALPLSHCFLFFPLFVLFIICVKEVDDIHHRVVVRLMVSSSYFADL